MNWGTKIAILYLAFVALILTLVFTCFGEKSELESKDYFAKEIQFQKQIDATENANALATPIQHKVSGKTVTITIPNELLGNNFKGLVEFIRPADASLDKSIALSPNSSGEQIISNSAFVKGVYKMKISFTSGAKSYFKENVIKFD
jgi:nitrogen fixation protein FixH